MAIQPVKIGLIGQGFIEGVLPGGVEVDRICQDQAGERIDRSRWDQIFERLKGLNLNFNLNVTRDALAEIVIDRNTGSSLRGRGDGNIRLNIDTNGRFEMFGSLTVDQGEYKFRNIVNKDFIVQRGGTIVWDGNPYNARLDILAINYTRANPAILLEGIASSRKIDVELHTGITGQLSSPDFTFDVVIPNASSNVASELELDRTLWEDSFSPEIQDARKD